MHFTAYGHQNIQGTHATTIEITTDNHLTQRGDCIIGVKASHSLADLREDLLTLRGVTVSVTFSVGECTDKLTGFVHPELNFTNTRAIILRKSSFLCPRTLLIRSSKAAKDLDRTLIQKMKDPSQEMVVNICRA